MFNRRKHYSDRLLFDTAAFNEVVRQLRAGGFNQIEIKIPEGNKSFNKTVLTPEEYVALNYNFVGLVLVASKENEQVKILFLNHGSTKTKFEDTVFPSSHSVASQFYVETNDPVRIVGLLDFIDHLLAKSSTRKSFIGKTQNFLREITTLYLLFGSWVIVAGYTDTKPGALLMAPFSTGELTFLILLPLSVIYLFFHTIYPGGVYIAPFEHRFVSFVRRLFAGDFKNNLLIAFLLFILKVFVAGFCLTMFTNVVWELYGVEILKYIEPLVR